MYREARRGIMKEQGLTIDTLVIGVHVRTWLHSETAINGSYATIST